MKKRMECWSKGSVLVPHFLIAAAHEKSLEGFSSRDFLFQNRIK